MKTNDDSRKKMIDTLIAEVNGTETHNSGRPEGASSLLEYVRLVEQTSGSSLVGIAGEDTIPEQPADSNVIYMAGIKPGNTVTFQNFRDSQGQPVSVTASGKDTMFALLLWNKQYWSYQSSSAGFILANTPVYPSVREGDELLPRVAPNVSLYGTFIYKEIGDFHAHQAIAYDPDLGGQLLFGVADSINGSSSYAYLYITNMKLEQPRVVKLPGAYRIQDIALGHDGVLYVVPQAPNRKSWLRAYKYGGQVISYKDIDLTSFFSENDNYIDSICYSSELRNYIVKAGEKIVFFDTSFRNKVNEIKIDLSDLHGDDILPKTMEYYNGHILLLSAGNWSSTGETKCAYLTIYRPSDNSRIETYRYPDSAINREAEGICKLGNGKYLFTHYGGPRIEVRLLDFNTPSHTHTLSDIMDLTKLGTQSRILYVNPQLEGKSHLAPDGSLEKPFPNVAEAATYAKLFQKQPNILLMNGNYGTVDLSNIHMDLTIKGMHKDACLIDRIRICKCRDLLFENITFCDSERPFEASASTIEINNCSFPNGKQSVPGATATYGINISRNSALTLKACEINHFDTAVNVTGSKLFIEGSDALKGTGNHCAVRGSQSIIWGTKELSGKVYTAQALSLDECQGDSDNAVMKGMNGSTKPSNPEKGQFYFDLEANKPLWWNGTHWADVTGEVY